MNHELEHNIGTDHHSTIKTISVVICAYNEEATVLKVCEKVLKLPFVTELVCVNNGSTDKTGSLLTALSLNDSRVKVIEIEKNKGLGVGLIAGIQATNGDIVVRQDADLEYDPNEIEEVIYPLLKGVGHVSYGSRLLVRKTHRANYFYNYLANIFFTTLSNIFTNINLTDVETASKAFEGNLIRRIPFTSKGFEIEIEMLFKLRKEGAVFYEVPVSYYGRRIEEGKKIRFIDAIHTLWAILKYGFGFRLLRF